MAMTMAIGGANLPALKEELDMTTIDVSMFGKRLNAIFWPFGKAKYAILLPLSAGLVFGGLIPGSLIAGILVDVMGRKKNICTGAATMFTGHLLLGFAQSVPILMIGRLLHGIAFG